MLIVEFPWCTIRALVATIEQDIISMMAEKIGRLLVAVRKRQFDILVCLLKRITGERFPNAEAAIRQLVKLIFYLLRVRGFRPKVGDTVAVIDFVLVHHCGPPRPRSPNPPPVPHQVSPPGGALEAG